MNYFTACIIIIRNMCSTLEENCKGMPMGSVYEATTHTRKRGLARETSHDVCKSEENSKGMSNHHSVEAVKATCMRRCFIDTAHGIGHSCVYLV
jgi:hypothetical protein